jgi:prepilin-type N-terminal cleavage/methylation domain-containing protein
VRRRGFTLVEVLATLVLIGIILPVAMRGVSIALGSASIAKHRAEAATLAYSKLNQMLAEGQLNTANQSGDFAPEHPDYHWNVQTAQRDYGLTEVQMRVKWMERGTEHDLLVSTLTYNTSGGSTQ